MVAASPEVNGQILPCLFQVGGKHGIWHKGVENSNCLAAIRKLMSELVQGRFSFSVLMLTCKDENVKFLRLKVHNLSSTSKQTTRKREE